MLSLLLEVKCNGERKVKRTEFSSHPNWRPSKPLFLVHLGGVLFIENKTSRKYGFKESPLSSLDPSSHLLLWDL